MLFNSIDFAIFLPVVFVLYWFIANKNLSSQNLLIVIASYIFYGWWDYRFLSLILFSTLVDYLVGLRLANQENRYKRYTLLWTSIAVNIGFLGFFKYYNFFIDNFVEAFAFCGMELKSNSLDIILPVGISFYTFQTLSYTIDVYKKQLSPTRDFIAFSAFVSFFPQLVAGPIERAGNFLPQFYSDRVFNFHKAVDGMRQILFGLFKKIVIADNCAEYANLIFNNSQDYNGATLLIGALFFTTQIYCDFSGYSDIAIGTARLFGFDLKQNFSFPYFSRNIAEFWRRWHISLSTWFRDYLYIPLGGSRVSTSLRIRNTFIIFVVSGFWHGANWTFIIWGALNAIYFLPLLLTSTNRTYTGGIANGKLFPTFKEFIQILFTFSLTVVAWVFFRSENVHLAFDFIINMFTGLLELNSYYEAFQIIHEWQVDTIITLIMVFIVIEWLGRNNKHALENIEEKVNRPVRHIFYYSLIFLIFWFGGPEQEFIYFQF